MTDKEKQYKDRVKRFTQDLYREMLFSIEWETVSMEKEKANAKRCSIKATEYLINATANFESPLGIQQDTFYIDVLQELESYD